jgi:hypothetical protein
MIPIIELPLKNSANPFITRKDNDSILHDIYQYDGILEPFLALPTLDLETRDSTGRAFLLSTCSNPNKLTNHEHPISSTVILLLAHGANIHTTDTHGRTTLHHLP